MKIDFLRCGIVPLLLCISGPVTAEAQELAPGQRVRVTAPELGIEGLEGELVRLDRDVLVLQSSRGRQSVPRTAVNRVEISVGRHGHAGKGALIGGLVVGGFVGQDMLRKPSQCQGSGNYGEICALVLLGSIAAGAGVGALIGSQVRHDDWRILPEDRWAVPGGRSEGMWQVHYLPDLVRVGDARLRPRLSAVVSLRVH